MTIFIGKAKMTDKGATEFISKQHDLVRQIVRAWCQSNIDHHFKNDKRFRKAVQKNQGILHSRGAIEALFTSRNYVFSTNRFSIRFFVFIKCSSYRNSHVDIVI